MGIGLVSPDGKPSGKVNRGRTLNGGSKSSVIAMHIYSFSQGSNGIPCRFDSTAKLGVDSGTLDHSEQNWLC